MKNLFLMQKSMLLAVLLLMVMFSSCQKEKGGKIEGYLESMDWTAKETFVYDWDASTFPYYDEGADGRRPAFGQPSVSVLNSRDDFFGHLVKVGEIADTVQCTPLLGWPGWEALPDRLEFEGKSVLAVSLQTWDYPLYRAYMRGDAGRYDLYVVAYIDQEVGRFVEPYSRPGVVAYQIPWIPADAEISLKTLVVETEEEAESAMAEWLSSGN